MKKTKNAIRTLKPKNNNDEDGESKHISTNIPKNDNIQKAQKILYQTERTQASLYNQENRFSHYYTLLKPHKPIRAY